MQINSRLSRLERVFKKNRDRLPFCAVCMSPNLTTFRLEFHEWVEWFRRSGLHRELWPPAMRHEESRLLEEGRLGDGVAFPSLERLQDVECADQKVFREAEWRRCPGCGEVNTWTMTPGGWEYLEVFLMLVAAELIRSLSHFREQSD
jgi:hypothetical protein